jgi:signal transduction histidine kinase/CheY-like chemotaxis protein
MTGTAFMVTIEPGLAGLIAAICLPIAVLLAAAALLLLRDLHRSDKHAAARDGEIEKLRDEIWQARESEERYRGLIEGQNDLILRRDPRGHIVYANAAFLDIAGRDATIFGTTFAIPALSTSEPLVTADGARSFDQEIETGRGRRWVSWVETTVREPDGKMLTQCAGRDITERREAETAIAEARRKAEAASAAKSRFLATVSHELRTPLSGILGMADLLMDTGLSAEQATYARAVKGSGESLLSLIGEILDFSTIEQGKVELVPEPFDLTALVEGMVELLAPRAQGKGIEIASLIAPRTPRLLIGDGARLRQVLLNLAGNAVKFTASGGVGLSVAMSSESRIVFKVADTGAGIAPERLRRIFDEFERGEGKAAGAGLGLAISHRLVEMMGGVLGVESELGKGSVFTAEIPLAAGVDQAAAPKLSFPPGSRALVIARSPFEAPFLCEKLRTLGFDVDQAGDSTNGMALLANTAPPELLVVDVAIGEEAARGIAAHAKKKGVASRLMLLSPFERRQFGAPTVFGFDGYLVKPIRERSLNARLFAATGSEAKGSERVARPAPLAGRVPVRVLLAEDDEVNALLATRLLERAGASVERHDNGATALDAALEAAQGRRPAFDLAILDIRMPGLGGNEVARRLRLEEARQGRARLRLVALTANAFPEDRSTAEDAGFDGFLVKPVRREDLLGLLCLDEKAKVA